MTKKVHLKLGDTATFCGQTRTIDTQTVPSHLMEEVTCKNCRQYILQKIARWDKKTDDLLKDGDVQILDIAQMHTKGTKDRDVFLKSLVQALISNRGDTFWKSIHPNHKREMVAQLTVKGAMRSEGLIPEDFTEDEIDSAIKEVETKLGW